MKKSILIIVFSTMISSAIFCSAGISITAPASENGLVLNKYFDIKWNHWGFRPEVDIRLSLVLLKNGVRLGIIASNIKHTQLSYSWLVGSYYRGKRKQVLTDPDRQDCFAIKLIWSGGTDISDGCFRIIKLNLSGPIESPSTQPTILSPRITFFNINNGDKTTDQVNVSLSSGWSRTRHAPTQMRLSLTGGQYWTNWLPYESNFQWNLNNKCGLQWIHFQVRNPSGKSRVVSDSIAYIFQKKITIPAAEIWKYLKNRGFTNAITREEPGSDGSIIYHLKTIELESKGVTAANGSKCEFKIFGDGKLAEGWEFVSYKFIEQIVAGPRLIGKKILKKPSPGSRSLELKVRLWTEPGINIRSWFKIESITLKIPCSFNWTGEMFIGMVYD